MTILLKYSFHTCCAWMEMSSCNYNKQETKTIQKVPQYVPQSTLWGLLYCSVVLYMFCIYHYCIQYVPLMITNKKRVVYFLWFIRIIKVLEMKRKQHFRKISAYIKSWQNFDINICIAQTQPCSVDVDLRFIKRRMGGNVPMVKRAPILFCHKTHFATTPKLLHVPCSVYVPATFSRCFLLQTYR